MCYVIHASGLVFFFGVFSMRWYSIVIIITIIEANTTAVVFQKGIRWHKLRAFITVWFPRVQRL